MLPEGIESRTDVKNELDFVQWYSEIENDLLESSYDEYQYAENSSDVLTMRCCFPC